MSDLDSMLSVGLHAVDLAAELVRTQPPGRLTAKGDRDYSTEVDYAIEQKVRAFLREHAPETGFLGEEEGFTHKEYDRWWAFDPIDGTVNFVHNLPLCGVSLALISGEQPVVGVIDLPMLSARYVATKGHGAYRRGQRLRVRHTPNLAEAVVTMGDYATGPDAQEHNRAQVTITEHLAGRALRIRMLGSAAIDLAWLADGRTDASISLSNRPWDVAAGVLIAREAGARVFDLDGTEHSTGSLGTVASSPELYDDLLDLVTPPELRLPD